MFFKFNYLLDIKVQKKAGLYEVLYWGLKLVTSTTTHLEISIIFKNGWVLAIFELCNHLCFLPSKILRFSIVPKFLLSFRWIIFYNPCTEPFTSLRYKRKKSGTNKYKSFQERLFFDNRVRQFRRYLLAARGWWWPLPSLPFPFIQSFRKVYQRSWSMKQIFAIRFCNFRAT